MPNFKKFFFTTCLLLALSSCIAKRTYQIATIDPSDMQFIPPNGQLRIFVDWKTESSLPFTNDAKMQATQQKFLFETIEESACCVVVNSAQYANVIIQGFYKSDVSQSAKFFSYLSSFTLHMIPSWREVNVWLVAQVQSGSYQKTYQFRDSMKVTNWLPLAIAMPFRTSIANQEAEMSHNLYRTLLLQIASDGFFGN